MSYRTHEEEKILGLESYIKNVSMSELDEILSESGLESLLVAVNGLRGILRALLKKE